MGVVLQKQGESSGAVAAPVVERAPLPRVPGVVIGEVRGIDGEGRIWLDLPPPWESAELAVCCLCRMDQLAAGAPVAVMFQEENPLMAVVVGPIVAELRRSPVGSQSLPQSIELAAEQQITLRCGKASIQMLRDGSLRIRGSELLSRASGTNRIRGGNIQIN